MFKFFLLLSLAFINAKCEDCDKLGTLLYEDLGCKPKTTDGKGCPTHYECDAFKKSKDSCLFQSKQLSLGQKVNDSLILGACRSYCHCIFRQHKDMAEFSCAILDCPEWEGQPFLGPGCYRTYTLGGCCSTGEKCGPTDDLAKCVVNGKEYKEGQSFYPPNTCLTCVCQKGFEGKFEEPFCQKSTCATQIGNSDKLNEYCAPVYFGETLCCPDDWICPTDSDDIKQITPKSAENSDLTCKWGKKVVKLGEGLHTEVSHYGKTEDVTCECVLPPLLTCKPTKK